MVTGQAEQLRQQVVRGIGWRRKGFISARRSGQKTLVECRCRGLPEPLAFVETGAALFVGDTSDTFLMGNGGR